VADEGGGVRLPRDLVYTVCQARERVLVPGEIRRRSVAGRIERESVRQALGEPGEVETREAEAGPEQRCGLIAISPLADA
jgi:hypothetical protein